MRRTRCTGIAGTPAAMELPLLPAGRRERWPHLLGWLPGTQDLPNPSDEITSPVLGGRPSRPRGYNDEGALTTGAREVQVEVPCRPQPPSIGNSSLMYPDVHGCIRYMEGPGEAVHRISEGRWRQVPGLAGRGPRVARGPEPVLGTHQHWGSQHNALASGNPETSTRALRQIPQRNCVLLRAGSRVIPHRTHVIRGYAPSGERARNNGARQCQVIPLVG